MKFYFHETFEKDHKIQIKIICITLTHIINDPQVKQKPESSKPTDSRQAMNTNTQISSDKQHVSPKQANNHTQY